MALIVNDRYAGDEAWQEWFESAELYLSERNRPDMDI